MSRNYLSHKGSRRILAFMMVLAMLVGSLGFTGIATEQVYALEGPHGVGVPAEELALTKVVNYYRTSREAKLMDFWELLAIYAANENLTDYVLPDTKVIGDSSMPSDYADAFITELIKGRLPDKRLAIKLSEKQSEETGSFGYEMSNQQAWAMIALDLYNRNILNPEDKVNYDTEKAIDYLMTFQTEGNFYYNSQYPYPGVDYTGAAAIALAPYVDTALWPDILEPASLIAALKYDREYYASYGNAGAAAFAIFGYNALGIAKDDEDYQAAITELIEYQVTNGGFYSPWADVSKSDPYYTKQAAVALSELAAGRSLFLSLEKNLTQYISVDVTVQGPAGIISKALTVREDTAIKDIAASLLTETSELDGYSYYIDGVKIDNIDIEETTMAEGQQLLALPGPITHLVSLTADNEEVNIGEDVTISLSSLSLETGETVAIGSGAKLMLNGSEVYTLVENQPFEYVFSPSEAGSYIFWIQWPEDITNYSEASLSLIARELDQAVPVSIRVEGIDGNILYNDAFTVTGSQSLLTVFDAITQALDHSGVPYETKGVQFTSINNIENDNSFITSRYWMYTVNKEQYLDGSDWVLPTTLIEDDDEIIVFCGSMASYPFVESTLQENGDVRLNLTSYQYDNDWNLVLLPIEGASVSWAAGTDKSYLTITDSGVAIIPAEYAKQGSYTLQIEKLGEDGIPLIIRLAPGYEISITSEGSGGKVPSNPSDSVPKVSVQVNGPDSGSLFPKTSYTHYDGMTALDILRRTGLNIGYSDSSKQYVSSIEGISEFDDGPTSGWLFKVNDDESILSSAATYKLMAGDKVIWFYTKDYTKEKGSKKWEEIIPDSEVDDEKLSQWPFTDVAEDDSINWYYTPVKYVYENGIFVGTNMTSFAPNSPLTRSMLVAVLARMSGADLDVYQTVAFGDVDIDSWYGPSLAWAKEVGIVSGYANADGSFVFKPEDAISRQDIAVMLNNYNEKLTKKVYEQKTPGSVFTDYVQIAEYARTAIEAMRQAGIIKGIENPDGSFCFQPLRYATRAEAATMIYNMLIGKQD